jgi:DNA-binding response OmpR family regulator
MAHVMIVDDDRTTVKLLQTLLELDGFEVSSAARGVDVLPLITRTRPDIILMDYHLSDIDGVEVLKQLKAHTDYQSIPVIMASGLDVEDEALAAGASRFLVKPFEPGELPGLFYGLIGKA